MTDSNAKKLAQFLTASGTYNLYDVQADSNGFFDLPTGTTAQRPSPTGGMIRFNSTLGLAEYYDGTQWKSIDSPPAVDSISPTTESDASANITITGSNFQSGATVKFIGDDGTEYNSPSVTVNSSTEIVATTPATALTVANEPYDVQVTNTSGLSGLIADALDAGDAPAWSTASGNIGNIYDSARSSVSLSVTATDADGDTITYALASGDSLPSGLSLNSSTGAITGSTSAVGSDTTTTFDIEAQTDNATTSRTFNIVQYAPVVQEFTSVGSATFSVPAGVSSVDVLVVAGGGGAPAGNTYGGGGGAGGLIYRPAFPVTPQGSVSYTVGGGGSGAASRPQAAANGQNSSFGTLTAIGGGAGGGPDRPDASGTPGGSGGGGGAGTANQGQIGQPGGTGTQPSQPGDSGSPFGFGSNGGGTSPWSPPYSARGGGGGGAAGGGGGGNRPADPSTGAGGSGKGYDIGGQGTIYYAGGGGGGTDLSRPEQPGTGGYGGLGGGGGAGYSTAGPNPTQDYNQGQKEGHNGTANRGGGGGAGSYAPAGFPGTGGNGGSGIVIVKY